MNPGTIFPQGVKYNQKKEAIERNEMARSSLKKENWI